MGCSLWTFCRKSTISWGDLLTLVTHTTWSPWIPGGQDKTRADSRFVPSQWETALRSNAVSHWLGTNLESALKTIIQVQTLVQVSNHPFPDSTIHGKIFNEMPWIQLLGVSISSLTWTPEWHVPLEHQVINYSSVCWAFNNFESVNSLKPS